MINKLNEKINFDKNNIALLGERNSGKTTILFEIFEYWLRKGERIIVFDSATEHKEKSIIWKIRKKYNNYCYIDSPEEEQINVAWNAKNLTSFLEYEKFKNLQSITLIDVAKYLELGHKEDILERKNIIRNLYKKFVLNCIRALIDNNIKHVKVIMDEIELIPEYNLYWDYMKNNDIVILNAIHNIDYVECCNDKIKIFYMSELTLKYLEYFPKNSMAICGDVCIDIVNSIFIKKYKKHTNKNYWCTDIASTLLDENLKIEVKCYNSNLLKDYNKYQNNENFIKCNDGLNSVDKYIKNRGILLIEPVDNNVLLYEIMSSLCVIICVNTAIFNRDNQLSGGHYVVAYYMNNEVYIFNPRKNIVKKEKADIDILVDACQKFGSWRILINIIK